ncbi:MAG TPA: helix-turn-helix domain-containing protein [Longimicrobiaceae bacterium]
MRQVLRPLLVLHPDARFRDQVRRAGGKRFEYVEVKDWNELRELVRTSPPAALIVVDPYESRDELASPLRALLLEFPSITVVAALDLHPDRYRDLRTLGAWGVAEIIVRGEDDTTEAIGRRIRSIQGRPLQSLLERSLPANTSGQARALLMAAAEVVSTGGQARELARMLYLSPRTLLRWCERAELPPPRRILVWMRVLMAAELLDDPGRTVSSVAHACGYSSDNSLRRALQDFLDTTPTTLRREGAFATAARAFLRDLARTREHHTYTLTGSRAG